MRSLSNWNELLTFNVFLNAHHALPNLLILFLDKKDRRVK